MRTAKQAVVFMAIVASCMGCGKKEAAQEAQPQQAAAPAAQKAETAQGGFATTAPASLSGKTVTAGGKGNVDRVNKESLKNGLKLSQSDKFTLEGWAVDDKAKTVSPEIIVELEPTHGGTAYYASAARTKRADVAKALKEPAYTNAGITLDTTLAGVAPGEYKIQLLQPGASGVVATPIQRKINVQ